MLDIVKDCIADEEGLKSYSKDNFDTQEKCSCGNDIFYVVCGDYVTAIICSKCKKLNVVHSG